MSETNLKDTSVHIVSTWNVGNERKVEDALIISSGSPVENDFGSNVSFETCVHLESQKSSSSPCELKVTLPSAQRNMKIVQVSVLSEARVIELYGSYGEYLSTMEATFIDEYEEMPVYKVEAKLTQPSYECSLKFVRSKRISDIWLYGICIYLERNETINHPDMAINFQIVNKILKESGHQLTEKAEKCKRFLQICRSASDASNPKISSKPDLLSLMKLFESKYLNKCTPFGSEDKNVLHSKCITDDLSSEVPSNVDVSRVVTQNPATRTVGPQSLDENFKNEVIQHVDQCFHDLEVKLMARVEEKLTELEKRQNEKVELIFCEIDKLQRHLIGCTKKSPL